MNRILCNILFDPQYNRNPVSVSKSDQLVESRCSIKSAINLYVLQKIVWHLCAVGRV
jgi:hypothetical protein